ncbi:MAG: hypothetical protein KGQ52_01700 [Alphaproteobacteria bacterium]|nr:hypothetical protein [Alphaproteobacteria bacterium]
MMNGADSRAHRRAIARPALLAVVAGLLCLPHAAQAARPSRTAKARVTLEQAPALPLSAYAPQPADASRFSFTAPGTAPGTITQAQSLSSGFRFTPSGQAESRRALSLGVATRVTTAAVDRSRAAAPVDQFVIPQTYGVALSLGWQGFAVSGGYSHSQPALATPLTSRALDQVNLGLSYGGTRWRTTLEGTAEHAQTLALSPLSRRYSLELGGQYRLAPRFSVTGGVRYRIAPEPPSLIFPNRDDQAVYLGTSLAF